MSKTIIYEPIITKLNEWITYAENEPKVDYYENPEVYEEYRKTHDRDCILTEGNLYADTIFSLWLPLRNTIVCLNDEQTINEVGDIYNKISFVKELVKEDNLEKLLPAKYTVVNKLCRLFKYGMKRGNVMILPERWLNTARGKKPYYDYMPVFLLESFPGGAFASAWDGLEDYLAWIRQEKLELFFDGEIKPENIKDLAQTGDIRKSLPKEGVIGMENLIDSYIDILWEREILYKIENRKQLADLQDYNTNQDNNQPAQKEVSMQINTPTRQILINNFTKVEEYLEIESPWVETLQYLDLSKNQGIKGVTELLEKIPTGYRRDVLQKFYEATGLKIRVEIHKDYELTQYDKNGRYPCEDAAIWNSDFLAEVDSHPELLAPQEESDLIVRIVFPTLEDEEASSDKNETGEKVVNNIFVIQM